MRFRFTVFLLVLNILLFSLIFFLEQSERGSNQEDQAVRLLIERDLIESIREIHLEGFLPNNNWQVRKEENNWMVSSPVSWPANPFAIQELLSQLKSISWVSRFDIEEVLEAGQGLDNFGLETPELSIKIKTHSKEFSLKFGAPTTIGNRVYVINDSSPEIYVLDRRQLSSLASSGNNLYDKRLFTIGVEETNAVQVQDLSGSGTRVRLTQSVEGWEFVSPIEAPVDTTKLTSLLSTLHEYEIDSFIESDNATTERFDNPDLRLTLEGVSIRQDLLILKPENPDAERILAKNEAFDPVFWIPSEFLESINNSQTALREKQILEDWSSGWSSMDIRVNDSVTSLQMLESGGWQVVFTDKEGSLQSIPAEESVVQSLYKSLRELEAVRFVSDAPSEADLLEYGILEPQRIISLRYGNDEVKDISIGNIVQNEALFYAKANDNSSVFLIRPFLLSRFPLDPLNYRSRSLYVTPENADITNLQLNKLGSEEVVFSGNENSSDSIETILTAFFEHSRMEDFIQIGFSNPLMLDSQTEVPLLYELSADIVLPGASDESKMKREFLLSGIVGNSTVFIVDPETRLVGIAPDSILRALEEILKSQD